MLICLHTAEVAGSNPASPTLKKRLFAGKTYNKDEDPRTLFGALCSNRAATRKDSCELDPPLCTILGTVAPPVNQVLNYAYAVLESQVRIAAVAQGLDPAIGYLHSSRPGRAALVYDLMEPLRPQVDRLILGFVRVYTFAPNDFILKEDGVCRLHPQLAKKVTQITVADVVLQAVVSKVKGVQAMPTASS